MDRNRMGDDMTDKPNNVFKFGNASPKGVVNTGLVEMLEGLLSRAKSGEIVGLAYAATNGQDTQWNGWDSGNHNLLLSSAIAILNAGYQSGFLDE